MDKSFASLSALQKPKFNSAERRDNQLNLIPKDSMRVDQKRDIFMGFDPVGTTGLLYALSVGSVVFLPKLLTAQTGPDRVDPLIGYDEEPKTESNEVIFGRLPKNHAHG